MKIWDMLKGLGPLKKTMGDVEKDLRKIKVTGVSGGGWVEIDMDGSLNVLKIRIQDELLEKDDKQMLIDLLVSAFNDAKDKSQKEAQTEMQRVLMHLSNFSNADT